VVLEHQTTVAKLGALMGLGHQVVGTKFCHYSLVFQVSLFY
jgi:hypothetical protein